MAGLPVMWVRVPPFDRFANRFFDGMGFRVDGMLLGTGSTPVAIVRKFSTQGSWQSGNASDLKSEVHVNSVSWVRILHFPQF